MIERIRATLKRAGFSDLPEDPEGSLEDFGFDSLLMALGTLQLEREFQFKIPPQAGHSGELPNACLHRENAQELGDQIMSYLRPQNEYFYWALPPICRKKSSQTSVDSMDGRIRFPGIVDRAKDRYP